MKFGTSAPYYYLSIETFTLFSISLREIICASLRLVFLKSFLPPGEPFLSVTIYYVNYLALLSARGHRAFRNCSSVLLSGLCGEI